jgi:rhodanese-related sulfurtransferase
MKKDSRRVPDAKIWAAIAIAVAVGLIPPLGHLALFGRARSVSAEAAKEVLGRPGAEAILVDVRTRAEHEANGIEGAASWPYGEIAAIRTAAEVPEAFRGKEIFLICDSGLLSALAAARLEEAGVPRIASVSGGMQEWVATAEKPCALSFCRMRAASGEAEAIPFRESPLDEQWAAVLSGFAVKPFYTLLSLVLAVVLWRRREPDLAAFRWAMVAFFIGENFCAANYLIYGERSILFEHLHSFGMVACFGLAGWAVLEGIDRRILRLSEPGARCAAAGLCHGCSKADPSAPCGLERVFRFIVPALAVLAIPPLLAEPSTVAYNTKIFGTFYSYTHPGIHQIYEIRFCPAAALFFLGASLLALLFKRREPIAWSKLLFAAGLGPLGFCYLRWVLLAAYREDLVWFAFWEEITELLFIMGAAFVLWTFRKSLLVRTRADVARTE